MKPHAIIKLGFTLKHIILCNLEEKGGKYFK